MPPDEYQGHFEHLPPDWIEWANNGSDYPNIENDRKFFANSVTDLPKCLDEIQNLRSALAGQAAEIETLRMRLSERCECSFEGSPRRQVTECHLHACLRCGTWENGDPIDWIESEERGEEIREDGGPTTGDTLRAEMAEVRTKYLNLSDTLMATMARLGITEESHGHDKQLVSKTIADHVERLRQSTLTAELLEEVRKGLREASEALWDAQWNGAARKVDAILSKLPPAQKEEV